MSETQNRKTQKLWKHFSFRTLSLDALKGITDREGLKIHSFKIIASLTAKHPDAKEHVYPSGMRTMSFGGCQSVTPRRLPGNALDFLEDDKRKAARDGNPNLHDRIILQTIWFQDPETEIVAKFTCKHKVEEIPPRKYKEEVINAENPYLQVGIELSGDFYKIETGTDLFRTWDIMDKRGFPKLERIQSLTNKQMSRARLMKLIPKIIESDLVQSIECNFTRGIKVINIGNSCRPLAKTTELPLGDKNNGNRNRT